MSFQGIGKGRLSFDLGQKKGEHAQFGALCYRMVRGKPQILLITSRTRRRWIIPKGWPMKRTSPADTAAIEAWEEAGVRGKVLDVCIGVYRYSKVDERGKPTIPCVVAVFPVKVKSLSKAYPERKQRRRIWASPKKAARKVAEPELRKLLKAFDPKSLR